MDYRERRAGIGDCEVWGNNGRCVGLEEGVMVLYHIVEEGDIDYYEGRVGECLEVAKVNDRGQILGGRRAIGMAYEIFELTVLKGDCDYVVRRVVHVEECWPETVGGQTCEVIEWVVGIPIWEPCIGEIVEQTNYIREAVVQDGISYSEGSEEIANIENETLLVESRERIDPVDIPNVIECRILYFNIR